MGMPVFGSPYRDGRICDSVQEPIWRGNSRVARWPRNLGLIGTQAGRRLPRRLKTQGHLMANARPSMHLIADQRCRPADHPTIPLECCAASRDNNFSPINLFVPASESKYDIFRFVLPIGFCSGLAHRCVVHSGTLLSLAIVLFFQPGAAKRPAQKRHLPPHWTCRCPGIPRRFAPGLPMNGRADLYTTHTLLPVARARWPPRGGHLSTLEGIWARIRWLPPRLTGASERPPPSRRRWQRPPHGSSKADQPHETVHRLQP